MLDKSKAIQLITISLLGLSTLTACNTVEGVGEDVRAAGEAIDNSAEENRNY